MQTVRVQQHRVLTVHWPDRRGKCLTHDQAAVRQAEVQQAGTSFGLLYLQRVLQNQHLHRVSGGHDPAANAGAERAQARGALGACD